MTIGERTTLTPASWSTRTTTSARGWARRPAPRPRSRSSTFDWDQQIQPRLGISFVPSLEVGDKLYFNFGRYYNTENKSLGRAASPTRIFTTRATFDATGKLLTDVPAANTQNKTVDAGLDPQYTDEYRRSATPRPFGAPGRSRSGGSTARWATSWRTSAPTASATAPSASSSSPTPTASTRPRPCRSTTRRDDRWMGLALNASYTWSRLEGNWDIDFGPRLAVLQLLLHPRRPGRADHRQPRRPAARRPHARGEGLRHDRARAALPG